jgi:outer membrane protein insertion porin family
MAVSILVMMAGTGCNSTKYVKDGSYLLRRNTVKIKSDKRLLKKNELRDNLQSLIVQKPNSYALGVFPTRIWLYNLRHKKYAKDTGVVKAKLKTVERPVIYDSSTISKSKLYIDNYLYNQGYFYSVTKDTTKFSKKKAYVTYDVATGPNYVLNKVTYDIDDSTIKKIILGAGDERVFDQGDDFVTSTLDEERNRLAIILRNNGYYNFSSDNISFQLDTIRKTYTGNITSILEGVSDYLQQNNAPKKPQIDISIIVRSVDSNDYWRYKIGKVTIRTDFIDRNDLKDDSKMMHKDVGGVSFIYHTPYVKENVILKHTYLITDKYYTQDDYDLTIAKLNELGIFQFVRVYLVDEKLNGEHSLDCNILLSPTKKYDITTNFDASNGTTYSLGSSVTLSFKNRNLGRGANQLSVAATGGIDTKYDEAKGNSFFEHFSILNKNIGGTASILFPKFLIPFPQNRVSRRNLPRTIVSVGSSLTDRNGYFTLTNTTANLTYNWKETKTNTWDISPAFVSIIRLPRIDSFFQLRLDTNQYLRNSYKQNFIEGENVSFTYNNANVKNGKNYTYIKTSLEEAGALLSGLTAVSDAAKTEKRFQYAQYTKLDIDARRYFTRKHSTSILRFLAGVGIPYDKSVTLPYIKQYFAGGAYSMRGWNVRSLGPGGYQDTSANTSSNSIDRTGDIKLEMNAEYRFDILPLFGGSVKLNGALFTDAGNIWLAKKDHDYPNGEFAFDRLGQDIAVSSGGGIRFDFAGLIVLRLDAAFPIKKPYMHDNSGWVINKISPFDPSWRANNMVLQLALGYPF